MFRDQVRAAKPKRKPKQRLLNGIRAQRERLTVTGGGDFAKRGRAQKRAAAAAKRKQATAERRERERQRIAAVRKRERDKAAPRVKAARLAERKRAARKRPASRSRRPAHDYRNCRDHDCERVACEAWREAAAEHYDRGFDDGVAACPRQHAGAS